MSAGRLGGQDVAIAVETTTGSPSATDYAAVDVSALTFNAVKPTRASSSGVAESATIPLYNVPSVSTSGAGQVPEVEAPYDVSDDPAIRELGEFGLTFKAEAASGLAFGSTRLAELLGSGLGVVAKAANTTQTVTASVSATVYEVGAGDIGDANPGDVVAWVGASRMTEFALVESVNVGTNRVTVRPAFSAAPQVGDVVRVCSVAYPEIGSLGATSLAVRYRDRARYVLATGCRPNAIALNFGGDDTRTAELAFTFAPLFKETDVNVASLDPPANLANGVALKRWGEAIYGDTITGARTVATLRSWSANIALGLDNVGSATTSIVGAADVETVSAQVTVSLTFANFARNTLRDWLRLGSTYTWVLPLQGQEGKGACLIIPAGYVSELPGDTIEDERSYSTVTISAASSPYTSTTGTPTAAAGAYFLLAFAS